jgi:putative SOS response-associated peptidase YedK
VCGRFTVKATWAELVALYRLTMDAPPHNLRPCYNVCPTDPVDVVTAEEGRRDLAPYFYYSQEQTQASRHQVCPSWPAEICPSLHDCTSPIEAVGATISSLHRRPNLVSSRASSRVLVIFTDGRFLVCASVLPPAPDCQRPPTILPRARLRSCFCAGAF